MRMIAIWLTMLVMIGCAPALAQDDMSTRQLKALSPHAANRKAQDDLLSIFEPVKKYSTGMFRGVRGVGFTTHAHGTEFEGLCSRDSVTLWYAPTQEGRVTADASVRPYKVTSVALFHFLKAPSREPEFSRTVWQDDCVAAGEDEQTHWFSASDPSTAVQGVLVLKAALEAIKSGVITPTCDPAEPQQKRCAEWVLAHSTLNEPPSVEKCTSGAASLCYVLGAWSGVQLTIKAQADGDSLTPGAILSVVAEESIIVT